MGTISSRLGANELERQRREKEEEELKKKKGAWWWKRILEHSAPGRFEDHNREHRQMTPDTFEGFRAEFNRSFGDTEEVGGSEFLVTHLATITAPRPMNLSLAPGGPRAAPKMTPPEGYMLATQFVRGPISLMGRVDRSRRVFGTFSIIPNGGWLRAVFQAQTQPPRDPSSKAKAREGTELAAEVSGTTPWIGSGTSHLKVQRTGTGAVVAAAGHMQSVAANAAVGVEGVHSWATGYNGVSFAGRWAMPNAVATALYSVRPAGLDVTFVQRVTRTARLSAELNVGWDAETGELASAAAGGWEVRAADMTLKGRIDNRGAISTSIEEALGSMFRVSLSAEVDMRRQSYIWGFGLQVSS